MNLTEHFQNSISLAPSLPLLPKILKILKDPNSSLSDLIQIVSMDPSLAAELLKTSNSAYFSTGNSVVNIDDAINRIGFQETYHIVSILASRSLLQKELNEYGYEKGEIWLDSVIAAKVNEWVARRTAVDPSTAYITGLLHNLGKLILNDLANKKESQIFDAIDKDSISFAEAEFSIVGTSSPDAGSQLLEHWKFSEEIYIPIKFQNKPLSADSYIRESCLLHLSNFIICSLGANSGTKAYAIPFDDASLEVLGVEYEDVEFFILECAPLVQETKNELKAAGL